MQLLFIFIKNNYLDTLYEARRKAKRAEETSELSSANDDKESRKIRHKKFDSSCEEISCNEIPKKKNRLSQKKYFKNCSMLDNPHLFIVNIDEGIDLMFDYL